MSRTYVALERSLGCRVVVKVLSPELAAGVSIERFKRDILLAAQLQHPHVVPVLSSGEAGGLPWFTMPYVEGESLRHRLVRGPLATGEAVSVLRDVARALAFAHSRSRTRTASPSATSSRRMCFITPHGVKLLDFGLARPISDATVKIDSALKDLAALGGWKSTATLLRCYIKPDEQRQRAALAKRRELRAVGVT